MNMEIIDDTNNEEETDQFEDESDEELDPRNLFGRRSRENSANKDDIALTNNEFIPMLPNANKKEAKEAVAMKVHKLNNPNSGYKGELHIGADEDYIANMWGDGIYTLEFINNKKKVLKKREGVKIAVGSNSDNPRDPGPDNKENLDALRLSHISHNLERKRSADLNASVIQTTKELAQQHTSMVTETAKAAATRDREFYSGQATSTQSFFASILQQQQQMSETARQNSEQAHRQQMEASERSHIQMITMLEMMHSRSAEQNNPMLMLQLFKQGMDMGRDIGGDDSEPWERAIKTGVEGLGQLASMQKLSMLGNGQTPARRQLPNPRTDPNRNPVKKIEPTINNPEVLQSMKEFSELKAVCDKRGVDFDTIIKEAREYLEAASEEELKEKLDESESNNPASQNSVG
jgi:hypothetical protein